MNTKNLPYTVAEYSDELLATTRYGRTDPDKVAGLMMSLRHGWDGPPLLCCWNGPCACYDQHQNLSRNGYYLLTGEHRHTAITVLLRAGEVVKVPLYIIEGTGGGSICDMKENGATDKELLDALIALGDRDAIAIMQHEIDNNNTGKAI